MGNKGQQKIRDWYQQKGWSPFPYQEQVMTHFLKGHSGILSAPTGMGKTEAVWLPILANFINQHPENFHQKNKNGLKALWITPLRALARDIEDSLSGICEDLGIPWSIGRRTGDTSSKEREKQKRKMPEGLVITPESLHLLLASKGYPDLFKNMEAVVVDEWHELMGTKRGVQTELALSRLRALNPNLQTWGISATIGNLEEAQSILLGPNRNPEGQVIIREKGLKPTEIKTIIPDTVEKFPWSGHIGIKLVEKVLPVIRNSKTALVFTNTRSQAEIWYQNLLLFEPDLAGQMALHHGSLDQELRNWVEQALHEERLKVVVCTSSLDLGVDFRPVETVIQVGSPKGVARFLQRAGRSGHQPGATSHIFFVPTNSLELAEAASLKSAIQDQTFEERIPVLQPYDVLIQYLLTLAVSEGFTPHEIYKEIRQTYAYQTISEEEFQWLVDFIEHGGASLHQYDEYAKVTKTNGRYHIRDKSKATRHRLTIGTIVGDTALRIKFLKGKSLGTIEEAFLSKVKQGEPFWFAGRNLELVRIKDMTAWVRLSRKKKSGKVPSWMGGRLPLSSQLAEKLREQWHKARQRTSDSPEMKALQPLLQLQEEWSHLPANEELMIEKFKTREGWHLLIYPFEGRYVHEGLAALVAHRISRIQPISFSMAMNDYGFELLSDQDIPVQQALESNIFNEDHLIEDINQSLNGTEMAKRKFRDIASIAGLIFKGYPGKPNTEKHLQSSAQLLFEVFREFEPNNPLLQQAYEEARQFQLEEIRLRNVLQRIGRQTIVFREPPQPTPFAFPIMVDRMRERLSTEKLMDRVEKMQMRLEKAADKQS